jgi:hypothetical protein
VFEAIKERIKKNRSHSKTKTKQLEVLKMNVKETFLEIVKQCMLVCLLVFVISFGAVNAFANEVQGKDFYEVEDISLNQPQNVLAAAPPAGTLPVYRFFNTETGTHFYTISEDEKNYVLATWPQFHLDGPAFYAYPIGVTPPSCTPPNAGTWTGSRFSFTVSSDRLSLYSWTLDNMPVSGTYCSYSTAKVVGSSSVSISNCGFSKSGTITDGGTFSFTGTFNSATSASGTYNYSNSSIGCSGSGTWTSSH